MSWAAENMKPFLPEKRAKRPREVPEPTEKTKRAIDELDMISTVAELEASEHHALVAMWCRWMPDRRSWV